jgi:hypothetical protein
MRQFISQGDARNKIKNKQARVTLSTNNIANSNNQKGAHGDEEVYDRSSNP